MPATFNMPATIITGSDARLELGAVVRRLGASRVLLVTDAFLVASGVIGRFTEHLEQQGLIVEVFADVQPDPTVRTVQAGLTVLRGNRC